MEAEIDCSFGIIPTKRAAHGRVFLLIQHINGNWGFPKGRPLAGETAEQAARRECLEEAGLSEVSLLDSLPIVERFTYRRHQGGEKPVQRQISYFLADVGDQQVQIQPEEIRAFAWLPYKEAMRRLVHPEGKATLRRAGSLLLKKSR